MSMLHYWLRWLSGALLRDTYMQVMDEADAERDLKNFAIASRLYRVAATLKPRAFHVWVQCGNCAKDSRQFKLAEAAYEKALQLNPDDADLHLQIGHLRKLEGHLDRARDSYARSLEIDDNSPARQEFEALATSTQPVLVSLAGMMPAEDRAETPSLEVIPLRVEVEGSSRYRSAIYVQKRVRQIARVLDSSPDNLQEPSRKGQVHGLLQRVTERETCAPVGDNLSPLVRTRSRQFIAAIGQSPRA